MEPNAENSCRRDAIKEKLRQNFDGKIVRKDLTKKIKEGANVPVYVLEFLLGQYCSSDDEAIIEKGVQNVKHILEEAGLSMANIVKTTVFLADMSLFADMNKVYATYFEGDFPARSAVAVKALPKEALVEIECIAVR